MPVKEALNQSKEYIHDVASKAHSNVKTFIQPENLKAFAKGGAGNAQQLAANAANKAKSFIENAPEMMKDALDAKKNVGRIDSFNYNYPKLYLLSMLIELIFWIWVFYYWNPRNIFSDHMQFTILFLLMWGFTALMQVFYYRERRVAGPSPPVDMKSPTVMDVLTKSIATIAGVSGAVALMYGLLYAITHVPSLTTIFQWGMTALIACGVLAFFYVLFLPVIKAGKEGKGKGLLGLLGALIMYVPCLLIDFADWIKEQYEITTSTAWIVLGVTSLAVAIMILLPKAITWMLNQDGVHLLRDPVYLDKEHQLSNHKQLEHIFQGDDQYGNSPRGYHYSISSWFWINPQPPNTRAAYSHWTNILEFGGRPAIEWLGTTNEMRVMCDIKGDKRVEIFRSDDIPFQSWNNVVINYDGGTMDVFLNGVLVASRQAAFYQSLENVIAGADKGIEGGICNVVFYDKILHPSQIEMGYKALRRMTQPVL